MRTRAGTLLLTECNINPTSETAHYAKSRQLLTCHLAHAQLAFAERFLIAPERRSLSSTIGCWEVGDDCPNAFPSPLHPVRRNATKRRQLALSLRGQLLYFFMRIEGLFRVLILPVGNPEDDRQPSHERHFQPEWDSIPWFEVGHRSLKE